MYHLHKLKVCVHRTIYIVQKTHINKEICIKCIRMVRKWKMGIKKSNYNLKTWIPF